MSEIAYIEVMRQQLGDLESELKKAPQDGEIARQVETKRSELERALEYEANLEVANQIAPDVVKMFGSSDGYGMNFFQDVDWKRAGQILNLHPEVEHVVFKRVNDLDDEASRSARDAILDAMLDDLKLVVASDREEAVRRFPDSVSKLESEAYYDIGGDIMDIERDSVKRLEMIQGIITELQQLVRSPGQTQKDE